MDLVEGYNGGRGRRSFWPTLHRWTSDMAARLKALDPNNHIVTSHHHEGTRSTAERLFTLPEMDFVNTNSYINVGLPSTQEAAVAALAMQAYRFAKPVVISEYGGHWGTSSDDVNLRDFHLGLWAGATDRLAATPLFWWWNLVDQEDRWSEFRGIAAFLDGVDPRGKDFRKHYLDAAKYDDSVPEAERYPLQTSSLGNDTERYVWVYNYYSTAKVSRQKFVARRARLEVTGLRPGAYTVELVGTESGRRLRREVLRADPSGALACRLPDFERDLAVRIFPEGEAPPPADAVASAASSGHEGPAGRRAAR
jgi:hypothetical protein